MKTTPIFRDIPCNKDIYYANTLIRLNDFNVFQKDSNILGAIILKWVKNDKIKFKSDKSGLLNKETSIIDLTLNPTFENTFEKDLFNMMFKASKNGILEAKEFEKWINKNYKTFLDLFTKLIDEDIKKMKKDGIIYLKTKKDNYHNKYIMNDIIYEDSLNLYGLKKYLIEFSSINTKEVMDVKLWDEYLMFAYLFGIADEVAKQLKDMYPNIMLQNNNGINNNFLTYDVLNFINDISYNFISCAINNRSNSLSKRIIRTFDKSSGFSSLGGGDGSFGGGGGGSR